MPLIRKKSSGAAVKLCGGRVSEYGVQDAERGTTTVGPVVVEAVSRAVYVARSRLGVA